MIDTHRLREAVRLFEFYSKPSSTNGNTPATVDDINRVIQNISKLICEFVAEIENR